MKEILIATKNSGKVKDFEQLFSPYGYQVKSLYDFPDIPDVEETGTTFRENAQLKAETISKALNQIVIADDSGLEVDALDERPGVFSARYAGVEKNDKANLEKVLEELKEIPLDKRTARFRCALALVIPNEKTILVEGMCEGKIIDRPIGENGFGYDPIFYLERLGKTMAQLTKEEKNKISHRANALNNLGEELKKLDLSLGGKI
ncbi:XTP/dITP diphosphatase [Bacillus timonensis]|nr:XTP/dITP diphosphatase [Bacillus timonensis]